MGSLTDRERATEPTRDQAPARRAGGTSVEAGSSPDTALARLQSTLGNQGMAAAMAGQAPDLTLAPSGPPTATAGDGGTLPGGTSTTPGGAGTPPGGAAASPADKGPAVAGGVASAPPGSRSQPSAGPAGRPSSHQPPGGAAPAGSPGAGPALPAAGQTGPAGPDAPSHDLIDQELVEHEQWAAARAVVGGARSVERAEFAADEVGAGLIGGGESGVVTGLLASIGVQLLEHGLEFLAGDAIPGVGQVVGGVMSAYALVQGLNRDMTAISHFGEGSGYEEAANDIEGICAVLDIVSNIVNVIAGVVGIVAVAAAGAALVTVGALSPLALAAGAIAAAIGVAGMVLGLVKTALLPLAVMFRALDAFTSQSDPRQVEVQGHTLEKASAEMGVALGGAVGGALGGEAGRRAGGGAGEEAGTGPAEELPSSPSASPPAGGDAEPLVVKGEPLPGRSPAGPGSVSPGQGPSLELDTSGEPAGGEPYDPHLIDLPGDGGPPLELDTSGEPATTPPDYGTIDLPPGDGSPELATSGEPAAPSPGYGTGRHPEQDLPSVIVNEEEAGLRPGEVERTSGPPRRPPERETDVDWDDPQVRQALGLDPVTGKPTGATLGKPGQLTYDPAVGQYDPAHPAAHGPFHGALGQMKNGEYAPESVFEVTRGTKYGVRAGPPGAWVGRAFDTPEEAHAYASRLAASGERNIRNVSGVTHAFNSVDAVRVFEVPAGTPSIRSVAAPQPEGEPGPGRPEFYPGGGPQTQLPKDLFPRPPAGETVSPAQHGEAYPVTDREGGPPEPGQPVPASGEPPSGELYDPSLIDLPGDGGGPLPELDTSGQPATPPADDGTVDLPPGGGPLPELDTSGQPATPPRGYGTWRHPEQDLPSVIIDEGPQVRRSPGRLRAEDLHKRAPGLAAATRLPRDAAFGARAATLVNDWRNQHGGGAVTRQVDPRYRPPPGSEADIQRLTAEAHRLLTARAQAEQHATRAAHVRDAAQAQASRVQAARQHVGEGLTATQAHSDEVKQHQQAADHSAQQHAESDSKVHSAADHLAGLATLEGLLAGWSHFTGLVLRFSEVLPNRAVNAFERMNSDSTEFMLKLAGIKRTVAGQQAQQPARAAQIGQVQARLAATSGRAASTRQQFSQAQEHGARLAHINQEHIAYAEHQQSRASGEAAKAGATAAAIEVQREARIQQMTEWATEHKAARQRAVDEVCRQMEARGLRVTQRPQR